MISVTPLGAILAQERRGAEIMTEWMRVWRLIGLRPLGTGLLADTWEGSVRRPIFDDLDVGGYGEGSL